MKKIKWLLFSICVICLIITIILFIKFINGSETLHVDEEIVNIYGVKLYRGLYKVYEDDELILNVTSIENASYIVLDEKVIKYCSSEEICDSSNYTYDNEKKIMNIENDIYIMGKGLYDMVIEDDLVKLSTEMGNRKTIYYFDRPKG